MITLSPGEVRFDNDVVAGLFSAPGTFGNLLIRIPESAPVIARVISFDTARAGSGAPIAPMTNDQAASAEGPLRRLLVPGSPDALPRRFNIDIVNVGEGTAEVEVRAIGSGGQMLGHHDVRVSVDGRRFLASVVDTRIAIPGRYGRAADRWLALAFTGPGAARK